MFEIFSSIFPSRSSRRPVKDCERLAFLEVEEYALYPEDIVLGLDITEYKTLHLLHGDLLVSAGSGVHKLPTGAFFVLPKQMSFRITALTKSAFLVFETGAGQAENHEALYEG